MRVVIAFSLALYGSVLPCVAEEPNKPARSLPPASAEDAWKVLPRTNPPLPAWALILVQSLPQTTGAMLDLDYLHRAKNPLGTLLGGKLRWAAADAVGCEYAQRYAEADLKLAGLKDADLKKLAGAAPDLPKSERALLSFARKMTREPFAVTDDEVAELIKHFGEKNVVAIVHTLAHANFQNRLFLALGVKMEPGEPLAPVDLKLDVKARAKIETPARPPWEDLTKATLPVEAPSGPQWRKLTFDEIDASLERQKSRKPRITLLEPKELTHLPAEIRDHATRVIWSNVSLGYQPELTEAWFNCMNTYSREARMNRLFSSSLFWVITRSNECFY